MFKFLSFFLSIILIRISYYYLLTCIRLWQILHGFFLRFFISLWQINVTGYFVVYITLWQMLLGYLFTLLKIPNAF